VKKNLLNIIESKLDDKERTKMKVIPEGYLFVMGDNRRFSQDSRLIGLISMNEVVGNTGIKFWPLNEMGLVD